MVAAEAGFYHDKRTAAPFASFTLHSRDRAALWCGMAILLIVRLFGIIWLPFVDSTEARYAEIARKMVETNDWITPQFAYGVPFWGKPPLHTWLSALGMEAFGVGPFGARIFILVTALLSLWLIYTWVCRNAGADQALVSVFVLSSSILFFGASAFVMTDMAMVLGTVLSMVAFHNAITSPVNRVLWGRMFFVGLSIGLLAKGPVATIITLVPLVMWVPFGGRWHSLGLLPWRSGSILALALTLPWYIAAEIKTPGFLRYFLVGEHFQRFVVSGWQGDLYGSGHAHAKGMIWLYGAAMFMPWTLFAATFFLRLQDLRAVLMSDRTGWNSYLTLSIMAPLLLFSPAANILPAYSLPAMPAAAVLLVTLWCAMWGAPGRATRQAVAASVGIVVSAFGLISWLAHVDPETLHLKTERELVSTALQIDPDMHLTYWGERSYSAEFYTGGKAVFTESQDDIAALASNGLHDALAVSEKDTAELSILSDSHFHQIGHFGRRYLFIEDKAQ